MKPGTVHPAGILRTPSGAITAPTQVPGKPSKGHKATNDHTTPAQDSDLCNPGAWDAPA